jgi:hypothetical protein
VSDTARERTLPHVRQWLSADGWLHAFGLGLGAVLLGLFLVCRDLPMVDLPQHAAQIVTWQRWDAGVPEVVGRFELNFRTPYLLAYPIARALAPAFGTVLALKLVVWLSVVLNLVAVELLARRLGHDPWLGLLGFVTAMGLCFYFGFISFILAMPFAVGALMLAVEHARAPSLRQGALLALLLSLVLTAHGVAFVLAFGTVGLILLRGGGSWLARWSPLVPPAALAAVWIAPGPVSVRIGGDVWDPSLGRLPDFPALLVSMGAADHASVALGLALLVAAALTLGFRLERRPERWAPLALLLLGYCFFPTMFRGIVLLHTRLPYFLLPVALLAFVPSVNPGTRHRGVARGAVLGVTLTWLTLFSVRLMAFQHEAAPFHTVEARLRPGLAMRPLIFDRQSRVFPGVPAFLHYSAYYYVEKGGTQGYSFAQYPLSVVRYRPDVVPTMTHGAEWRPDWFRPEEIPTYDCFLVRSAIDRSGELFAGTPVELEAHAGNWWAYARRESALVLVPKLGERSRAGARVASTGGGT